MKQKKDFSSLITSAVENRIISLESEIMIMDEQIPLIGKMPGANPTEKSQLIARRNIKSNLHDLLTLYLDKYNELNTENDQSMKNAIKIHFTIFKMLDFIKLKSELLGHRSALDSLVGHDYLKYSRDEDVPDDMQLRMIFLVFPYEFVFDLLEIPEFCKLLLTIINNYSPTTHTTSILSLFQYISQQKPKAHTEFFTINNPLFFAISEHFIILFTNKQMKNEIHNEFANFVVYQKCCLLHMHKSLIKNCKENLINILFEEYNKKEDKPDSEIYLRPMKNRKLECNPPIFKSEDLPYLNCMFLELQKIIYQPSPSLMLSVLANAWYWLTNAISIDGNFVGAEEQAPFFQYGIVLARFRELPATVDFIQRFIYSSLLDTKFNYLLTQLIVALSCIDEHMLEVPPLLLFPFNQVPKRLKADMIKSSEEPIMMEGFTVYAFPTWSLEYQALFPAMVKYTGKDSDIAVCYTYKMTSTTTKILPFNCDFSLSPTIYGSFFHLNNNIITEKQMIHISSGNFGVQYQDFVMCSTMMMMYDEEHPQNFDIKENEDIYSKIRGRWKLKGKSHRVAVQSAIAEIQKALVILELLPKDFVINGVLEIDTVDAMFHFYRGENKMTPELFDEILTRMKRKYYGH